MLMLMSAVETGQMSAVETGQMSAAETGHCGPDLDLQDQAGDGPWEWVGPGLSSVETRQMSQQQSSVLSQQQTSVLSQQKTSILSQQKTRQLPASGRLL